MFSEFAIEHKYKISILLSFILLLILGNNLLERNNLNNLKDSFTRVYQDRLLAESFIFNMAAQLSKKELITDRIGSGDNMDLFTGLNQLNSEIAINIYKFEHTNLTPEEAQVFTSFLKLNNLIMVNEQKLLRQTWQSKQLDEIKQELTQNYNQANLYLNKLSEIQVKEGTILNDNSSRIMSGSFVASTFEISLLIIIGLFIQLLIFASRSAIPKHPQNQNLN